MKELGQGANDGINNKANWNGIRGDRERKGAHIP